MSLLVGVAFGCALAVTPALAARRAVLVRAERLVACEDGRYFAEIDCGARSHRGAGLVDGETPELADELILVIVAAALRSGAALPRALCVVGHAVGGKSGAFLARFDAALGIGYTWPEAMQGANAEIEPVLRALEPSWSSGVDPDAALKMLAEQLRRDRQSRAKIAAGKLAVRLVLPLGLCFLPAFVALGLFPLILGFTGL